MKKNKILLGLVFLFLFYENILSQTSQKNINDSFITNIEDTLVLQRGNLELLTQRIHTAFVAYTTGSTKLYKGQESPIILVYDSDKSADVPISKEELKQKTIDMVESIEIIYDRKKLAALYGTSGLFGVIKVKFLDNQKAESK